LIEHQDLVPFVEELVSEGYVLGGAAFEAGAALEVDEPWELCLFFGGVGGGSVVRWLVRFQG
jgi:hypothetical protein